MEGTTALVKKDTLERDIIARISTSVLPGAIPVRRNHILSAVIPKDHSNAYVFLDT